MQVMESDSVSGDDDEKTKSEEEDEEPCAIDKYWDLPSLSGYFGDIDPTTAKLQRLVRSPVDNPSANSLNFRPIVVYGENGEYSSVVTSAGAITFGCDLIDGTYVPMGHETSLEFPKSDAKDASIFITPTFEEDAMFTKWVNTATSSIVESAVEPTIHPAFANIADSVKKSDKCKGMSDDEATEIAKNHIRNMMSDHPIFTVKDMSYGRMHRLNASTTHSYALPSKQKDTKKYNEQVERRSGNPTCSR
jgi:hypothetical protein